MANIKVAVRVRPISARELNRTGSEVVVRTDSKGISLTNLKVSSSKAGDSRERTRRYGFDYCFDSSNPEAENYANQAKIYETLGQSVLDSVFSGFNSCLVAYGQSASGKTYTMMGTKEDPGLTPRLCEGLFERIEDERRNERTHRVYVSYLEIYNERVRDLLKPSSGLSGLRVREHPRLGPYVQGLTHHVVCTLGSLMSYVEEGTRARKTASTLQNPSSSRSHALLTITVSPESTNVITGVGHSTASTGTSTRRNENLPRGGSKLHLVDLAGSESAATCSGVHRLKEGANINKSLVALGNVISALAERGSTGSGPGRRFIPYRDSSLTWLLKDALGGNATTIMLATISPASGSYNETSHTLRFAQRAQSVVNRPVVNEDPVARIIRELRDEISRLKALLLEKNIQPESKSSCSCNKNPVNETARITNSSNVEPVVKGKATTIITPVLKTVTSQNTGNGNNSREEVRDDEGEKKLDGQNIRTVRRFNSSESIATYETVSSSDGSVRRYGSCELLVSREPRFYGNYNRAKVTELNDEEDEISEINESVFVDIPTLVAVLIKPDDNLQERSAQIEEICSDEVPEDSIDAEFIGHANNHDTTSCTFKDIAKNNEVERLYKHDSIDSIRPSLPSNLQSSKRFGSVETIQKKKEPLYTLQRSHTNVEKRPTTTDKTTKLKNINEIDDQKSGNRGANIWRGNSNTGSKDNLRRKGSNDSDKSLKDSTSNSGTKSKNYARKPSLENLKRKTSKDSSSSSSKDEQILISSLTRDKLLRRKNSLEQESVSSLRTHTPIQRAKRADIVAAVTERLYSSRKHTEENAPAMSVSGVRSPPEGTDVKLGTSVFAARTKLQELSRKMLAKRRRVSTDTQTDFTRTIRMKDTASLTEQPEVHYQDVAVLTEHQEHCDILSVRGTPVLRVKEIATLTEKPRMNIVRCKDVGSLANDIEDYDCETIHSSRNDSGILSDDPQNYAESNLSSTETSDFVSESERRVVHTENSTNTPLFSSRRTAAVQTPEHDIVDQQKYENKKLNCERECCNRIQESRQNIQTATPEKSVISISLPDMINITIESTNMLESKIAVMDGNETTEEKVKYNAKNSETQTDERNDFNNTQDHRFSFKDFTRSTPSQTDGRVFRIENIFQDPNNTSSMRTSNKMISDSYERSRLRNSVIFTNSLGTSYPHDVEADRSRNESLSCGKSFARDGLITETFITKKLNVGECHRKQQNIVCNDAWINWGISPPANSIQSIGHETGIEFVPSYYQTQNNEILSDNLNVSFCMDHATPVSRQNDQMYDEQCSINKKGSTELNTLLVTLDDMTEHEYNFSDDSLDYIESSVSSSLEVAKGKTDDEHEIRESLCPPDVVAHTKKESLKTSNNADLETNEITLVASDFEDGRVELPKSKPNNSDFTKIHDYESLILGKTTYDIHECTVNEDIDSTRTTDNRTSKARKKKVSFSNTSIPEERKELDVDCDVSSSSSSSSSSRKNSSTSLKSIIKKKQKNKKKKTSEKSMEIVAQSSNDETDGSLSEDKNSLTSQNDDRQDNWPIVGKLIDTTEIRFTKTECDADNSLKNSKAPRRRDKFSTSTRFENIESDSGENVDEDEDEEEMEEEDEENVLEEGPARNILEEYLNEAVTFMRNMNSINEYMSATKTFEKYLNGDKRCRNVGGRGKGGRSVRRKASWDRDYVEFKGRRVSLKDDTDKYLKEDEDDIHVPTESYERCIKGIQRLENCIRKVDKQNELLREKYGINFESAAGARLSLASPSTEELVTLSTRINESTTIDVPDISLDRNSRDSSSFKLPRRSDDLTRCNPRDKQNRENDEDDDKEDDFERRIFDQLMRVADSAGESSQRKLRRGSFIGTSDVRSRCNTTYSKFREKLLRTDESAHSRDLREARNLSEFSVGNRTTEELEDTKTALHMTTDKRSKSNENIYDEFTEDEDMADYVVRYDNFKIRETINDTNLLTKYEIPSCRDVRANGRTDRFHGSTDFKGSFDVSARRVISRDSRERNELIPEDIASERKGRNDVSTTKATCLLLASRSETTDLRNPTDSITGSMDSTSEITHLKDKLKYPGSPRARFLELLRERRRIVESSRGTSAS